MGGPRLISSRPIARVPLAHRTFSDKLQELSLRSPEDVRSLETLADYAIRRLNGELPKPRHRVRVRPTCAPLR